MQKRKFTVVTQLHEKNNSDLIKYMEWPRKWIYEILLFLVTISREDQDSVLL